AVPRRGRPISVGTTGGRTMSIRRLLPRLALALLLVAVAALAAVYRGEINPAVLDAWLGSLGPWAPGGYVARYALPPLASGPRAGLRPCRRRLVRGDLGQPLELAGRHARRHPCVPGRALHRRRLGCAQGRRAAQTADRRGRRGGLALRRLGPACPAVPVQSLELRVGAHAHPAPALRHRHAGLHGARRGGLHLAWA